MERPRIRTRITRKIMVDDLAYFWTIHTNINTGIIYCKIGSTDKRNHTFEFYCHGGPSHERTPMYLSEGPDHVDAITPGVVRMAIQFVNNHVDWQNSKETWITYSENCFTYSEKLDYWQWESIRRQTPFVP